MSDTQGMIRESGGPPSLRRKIHAQLQGKPVKGIMNIITIIMALLMDGAIIVGLVLFNVLAVLHWIVAIYLFVASILLIIASIPLDALRKTILRWFLFLSTYNGKSAFLLIMATLMFGLGVFAIIVACFMILLAILHFVLWLFFRDLVTDHIKEGSIEEGIGSSSSASSVPTPNVDYTYSGAFSSGSTPPVTGGGYGYVATPPKATAQEGGYGTPESASTTSAGMGGNYGAIGGGGVVNPPQPGTGVETYTVPAAYDSEDSDSD